MVRAQLLTSLLTALIVTPKVLAAATLPHNPLKELDFGSIFDPSTFNDTISSSGTDILDALFNDPEIPFTEPQGGVADVADHNPLQKRALKRYNYLKWKVTLKGYVSAVKYRGDPNGQIIPFTCTSADVYVFDKFRGNARDILIKWRNPNGGDALPGSIYWMTNKRLYKFLLPGDSTEPNWYDDTVPVIWEKTNQLYAWETYRAGQIYNRRNQFTARYSWFAGWALPETVRSGGTRISWAATGVQKMTGEIYVHSLGFPLAHIFYYATISGQFQLKSYANL